MNSTRSAQDQESDVVNLGGTAPGGITAFIGGKGQWNTPNALKGVQNTPPGGTINPVEAHAAMHQGLADEAPDASGNVPIHPGLAPGKYRTGDDANPKAPDGKTAVANDGRPISPDGRHRGESPEVPKQSRGPYRP